MRAPGLRRAVALALTLALLPAPPHAMPHASNSASEPSAAQPRRLLASAERGLDSELGTRWRLFTDTVMGGVSSARLEVDRQADEPCLRLRGTVRLENNGGFVQMSLELAESGLFDARGWRGLALRVRGNGERYNVHLRTSDLDRPWQSYRASFTATPAWQTVEVPFERFEAHRTDAPLDLSRLTRIGLLGIGRAFETDLCLGELALYR